MLSILEGARAIRKILQIALEDNDGCLIGRNGSTELELMIDIDKPYLYSAITNNAGVFPLTKLAKWQLSSIQASQAADVLATSWYKPLIEAEQIALNSWKCTGIQIPLRSLEPYYVNLDDQWINLLAGHRVAVISSFTKTMEIQSKHLDAIWGPHLRFPEDIDWSWIQTGYSPSVAKGLQEWPPEVRSWSDAVEYVVSEAVSQNVRFALIGCGGLGMPIAKALKDRGIIAIVLGGSIQILFGIKGRRWANHEVISRFWNEAWIWPSEIETPRNAKGIEGGCYWQ